MTRKRDRDSHKRNRNLRKWKRRRWTWHQIEVSGKLYNGAYQPVAFIPNVEKPSIFCLLIHSHFWWVENSTWWIGTSRKTYQAMCRRCGRCWDEHYKVNHFNYVSKGGILIRGNSFVHPYQTSGGVKCGGRVPAYLNSDRIHPSEFEWEGKNYNIRNTWD